MMDQSRVYNVRRDSPMALSLYSVERSIYVWVVVALFVVLAGGCATQGSGRTLASAAKPEEHDLKMSESVVTEVKGAAGLWCKPVNGAAEIKQQALKDGVIAWTVLVSSEARAALESHVIIGSDGREYADLVALDCFIDAALSAAGVCSGGSWMHDIHDKNAATHVGGGRLKVRGVCTSGIDRGEK